MLNQTLKGERQVLPLLQEMSFKLSRARRCLNDAHEMSQLDVLGGGAMVSMKKTQGF
jgi:hypothetical protein